MKDNISLFEQSGGTYHEENGYLIPFLRLSAAGAAFSSKWSAALGSLGIVSSIILGKESSHKSNGK